MNTVPAEACVDAEAPAVVAALAEVPVVAVDECDGRLVEARCGQENRLGDVCSRHLGVLDPGWELNGEDAASHSPFASVSRLACLVGCKGR